MSAVLNTHGLLWYLLDNKNLLPPAVVLIDESARGGSPAYLFAISLVKVTYLMERGRIPAAACSGSNCRRPPVALQADPARRPTNPNRRGHHNRLPPHPVPLAITTHPQRFPGESRFPFVIGDAKKGPCQLPVPQL